MACFILDVYSCSYASIFSCSQLPTVLVSSTYLMLLIDNGPIHNLYCKPSYHIRLLYFQQKLLSILPY